MYIYSLLILCKIKFSYIIHINRKDNTEAVMARIIQVDTDTLVGYNFLLKRYYVTNKGTTTYRSNSVDIKKVLDIVAPENLIMISDLTNLREDYERLTSLSYTINDTGAYVSSIQFNSYEDYPLILDCPSQKMYIKGTNLLCDLSLNEPKEYRVSIIQKYYLDYLGLNILTSELNEVYDFLYSYYTPTVYNVIENSATLPLMYSNKFALSNWDSTSEAVYNCTCNPLNKYSSKVINYIVSTNTSTNSIILLNPVSSSLSVGDSIEVAGATLKEATYTYSADGTYTIKAIEADTNTIYVEEPISSTYIFPYPTCYAIVDKVNILNISRDNSTIQLSVQVPNTYKIGDVVHVEGTTIQEEFTQVSADGTYTIAYIQGDIIGVQEQPQASYAQTESLTPFLSHHLNLGNVNLVSSNTIYFTNSIPQIQPSTTIAYTSNSITTTYTCKTSTTNSITINEEIPSYTPQYPTCTIQEPHTDILVNVTSSKYEEAFPIGEFIVDNFKQCQKYLNLLPDLLIPTDTIYSNINSIVPSTIQISSTLSASYIGVYTPQK